MHQGLTQNPFYVLGLSLTASQQDVVDAYDDGVSDDPGRENSLAEARQALLTPRTRLGAELGFLPDTPEGEARRLVSMLKTAGSDTDAILASALRLSPLSRGNLLSTLASRRKPDADLVVHLNGAQAEADADAVARSINRARKEAGIVASDENAVRDGLPSIFENQNVNIFGVFEDPNELADVVNEATKRILALGDEDRTDRLDALLQAYWRAVSRETSDIQRFLQQCGEDIMSEPSDQGAVESYIASLQRWDRFGQPLQVFEQAKGREEREAQAIQRMVRLLCLDLANVKSRSDVAFRISEAASAVFAELDRASKQLSDDLEQLRDNIALEKCAALEKLAKSAKGNLLAFAAEVGSSPDPVPDGSAPSLLVKELIATLSKLDKPLDYPWVVVRGVSVDMFTETKNTEATRVFTQRLLRLTKSHEASVDVVVKLTDDLRDLERIEKETGLSTAIQRKDWATANALVDDLLKLAGTDEERKTLRDVKSKLAAKREQGGSWKVLGWIAAAVVAIGFIGNLGQKTPSTPIYTPTPTWDQPRPLPPINNPTLPPRQPEPSLPPRPDYAELKPDKITPAMGVDGPRHSLPEIRYCVFESSRLEKIRGLAIGDALVDRFNAAIQDLNDRCSRYTYRRGELQSVEMEAVARDSVLAQDAQTRVREWRAAIATPQQPAPATLPGYVENRPAVPAGNAAPYSRENVRYCLYQEARISAAQRLISDSAVMEAYGRALADWRSICQRYPHRQEDMSAVRVELIVRSDVLRQEGEALFGAWRASAPPSPPPVPERQITADLLVPDEARRVQVRLAELGYFKGPANGTWGPASRSAMRNFNSMNGFGDTDIADTTTVSRLFAASAIRPVSAGSALPRTYIEATYPPPSGATLNPLNKNDAARIHTRLREFGFFQGKNDTLWSGASRVALREFKAKNGLPADEVWDAGTETALLNAMIDPRIVAEKEFETNIIGRWSTEPNSCSRARVGDALPITISKERAAVSGQGCEFLERQGSGMTWTVRASCRVDTDTWIANIRLTRNGDSLIWSSERGTTVYRRCTN